jgi:hypothetical protein
MAFLGDVRSSQQRVMRLVVAMCLVGAAVLTSSCIDEGDGFPDIVSMEVSPSTVSRSQMSGMTDRFVDISITVADFEGGISDADAFIQLPGGDQDAAKDDFTIVGSNTIELTGVDFTWFSGLEPGDYQVGATVVSDAGERVQELDLTTVSITE